MSNSPLLLSGTSFKDKDGPSITSNHTHSIVWYEITYPFPNFNGAAVEVWEYISNLIPHLQRV